MGHPVGPLSPLGTGLPTSVPHMDGWVLEETKKLEAQQRLQQRKLLDLKQVCVCVCSQPCYFKSGFESRQIVQSDLIKIY